MPKVSVGIPAYNEELSIAKAIESVIQQSFADYELIISNNGSCDSTQRICEEYSKIDSRIRLMVHGSTILPALNFGSILSAANGEFFAFLAADDFWEPDFLSNCVLALELNPHAAAVTVKTYLASDNENGYYCIGTTSLTGFRPARVAAYLDQQPSDNSRFYGLHRAAILRRSFSFRDPRDCFHAFDWAVMAVSVWNGSHVQVDKSLLIRESTGAVANLRRIENDNRGHLWFGLPLLPMSIYILRYVAFWAWPVILPSLIRLNLRKLKEYRASLG